MIFGRSLLASIAVLAGLAGAASAQPAPDCNKAKTPSERAICGNPDLAAADRAMATTFTGLFKTLPPGQQSELRASQRQWVGARDAACSQAGEATLAACLLGETDKRRRFLAGEGANGSTAAPKLLPAFFDQTRKGLYEISVEYPQFVAPAGPKFNREVHDLVLDPKSLSDYRQPNHITGASNFYDVDYQTTYLDPHLASVTLEFSAYGGGAHPNTWRSTMPWDPASDKAVELADFLADPKTSVPAIGAVCHDKLAVEARAEDWDFFDNADFGAVVGDPKTWAIGAEGVTILFNPYSIAAYVVGPRDCRLTYAELKEWLKPGGVLPPH